MPRASRRLDLLVVPVDPWARPLGAAEAWLSGQLARGRVGAGGERGPRADELVEGGFARVRIDAGDRMRLHGNHLGGFRVRCPGCARNLAPAFSAAWSGWAGAPPLPSVRCDGCGWSGPPTAVVTEPPVALGSLAVVFADVASAALRPGVLDELAAALGPARPVWGRPPG